MKASEVQEVVNQICKTVVESEPIPQDQKKLVTGLVDLVGVFAVNQARQADALENLVEILDEILEIGKAKSEAEL